MQLVAQSENTNISDNNVKSFCDSMIMLMLNEKAYSEGLIDIQTKNKITNEIYTNEKIEK